MTISEGKANSLIKSLAQTRPDKDSDSNPDPVNPNGNVASVDVEVNVLGENTYADVETSVLAVEDALSTVNVLIDAGLA
jgi:hypothetical protein